MYWLMFYERWPLSGQCNGVKRKTTCHTLRQAPRRRSTSSRLFRLLPRTHLLERRNKTCIRTYPTLLFRAMSKISRPPRPAIVNLEKKKPNKLQNLYKYRSYIWKRLLFKYISSSSSSSSLLINRLFHFFVFFSAFSYHYYYYYYYSI